MISFRVISFAVAGMMLTPTAGVLATPTPKTITIYDTSGNFVPGATLTISGTTLTGAGAANTVTATNLLNNASLTGLSIKYYDLADGTGTYSFVFDPATVSGGGEAHFVITASKSGVTINQPTFALDFYKDTSIISTALPSAAPGTTGGLADYNTVSSTNTQTNANGTAIAGIPVAVWTATTRNITGGTITAYTGNTPQTGDAYPQTTPTSQQAADYAALNQAAPGSPTGGSLFAQMQTTATNFTTLLGRIPQVVLFDASGNVKANALVLPATVPAGYGGGTSAGGAGIH